MTAPTPPLLQVEGLVKHFPLRGGIFDRIQRRPAQVIRAVDGVDLTIREGETLALVGESGCGKSTTGRCILYLQDPTAGTVKFRGQAIDPTNAAEMRERRKQLQIVFQDPNSSLNPRMSVGQTLEEALAFHKIVPKAERSNRMRELLETVGLNDQFRNRYANELSGGQRQRIGIARALAVDPEIIVADEAVSALDVSVQAQILQLLTKLREEQGLAYLFISHQLGVVRSIADAVAVMYLGKIVEQAPTEQIFRNPLHPYTQALMAAAPIPNPRAKRERIILMGDPPSAVNPPSGCRFRTRCRYATELCAAEVPALREIEPAHLVACHYAGNLPEPTVL
jgi:peptide/nickel transport system ATP-binding protein/oligopeptide transport system ATP-binding protein